MFEMGYRGVMIPEGQGAEPAPPLTLQRAAEVEFLLVEYGNHEGRKVTEVVVILPGKDGPVMYQTPNGIAWTGALKALPSKLNKQLHEKLALRKAQETPKVPENDVVDVTA